MRILHTMLRVGDLDRSIMLLGDEPGGLEIDGCEPSRPSTFPHECHGRDSIGRRRQLYLRERCRV